MGHRELGNLLRISRCFDSYRRQRLRDADIYPALYLFVSHVCMHPGLNQEELADEVCVDKTTAAHHLCRLEEKGYVERRMSSEDGRCRLVYPTEKALKLFPLLSQTYEEYYEGLMRGLSEEDRQQVMRLGEKLCENARAMTGREKDKQ